MTIVQCRRRAADAKWLALSVSANTPELRAEREARSSKKAGTKDGMKASTAEGNSLRWKKLHFLACLICISTEIHRNTVSAFPYNNCRLKLKATGTAASTRHSK